MSVRAKFGEHGGREIRARRDIADRKVDVEPIRRDPCAVDEAAWAYDGPGDVVAGREVVLHPQHIFVQRAPDDVE